MAEQEYTDQEPLIPFKIQAYTKSGKARFACLINTIAEHSPTGRSVLRAAPAKVMACNDADVGHERLCLPRKQNNLFKFGMQRRRFD